MVWPGLDAEGEAEEPDSVPVPVPEPVPVVPPVVEPLEGAVLEVAFEARDLNSVREREALAAVLEKFLLATRSLQQRWAHSNSLLIDDHNHAALAVLALSAV